MNNIDENKSFNETTEGAKGPISGAKLKEYGKKAYSPIVNVVFKYQDEIIPYLNALSKGLQGGVESLNKENSTEEEKYVSGFFKEAADGLNQACQKLQAKDVGAFTNYLSDLGDKKPSLMFSTSYIAGLFFGRLGRHIVSNQKKSTSVIDEGDKSFINDEPPGFDQSIH